jgi:hypothetical protein
MDTRYLLEVENRPVHSLRLDGVGSLSKRIHTLGSSV